MLASTQCCLLTHTRVTADTADTGIPWCSWDENSVRCSLDWTHFSGRKRKQSNVWVFETVQNLFYSNRSPQQLSELKWNTTIMVGPVLWSLFLDYSTVCTRRRRNSSVMVEYPILWIQWITSSIATTMTFSRTRSGVLHAKPEFSDEKHVHHPFMVDWPVKRIII